MGLVGVGGILGRGKEGDKVLNCFWKLVVVGLREVFGDKDFMFKNERICEMGMRCGR